jgi:esterase/lipase superfamily enzyme
MTEEYHPERLTEIARSVLASDPESIDHRKVETQKRLQKLSAESQPVNFAEAHFELACCSLLREVRRVKVRHIEDAEQHYALAIGALVGPKYAILRGTIHLELAEGFDRLRSKKSLHDTVRTRTYEMLKSAAVAFLESQDLIAASAAYTRLAEVSIKEGDSTDGSQYAGLALSYTLQDTGAALDTKASVLDRLFIIKERLAEVDAQEIVVGQETFSAANAQESIAAAIPTLTRIPSYLLDELLESVDDFDIGHNQVYSPRELVQSHRRRNTLYMSEPPPDRDLQVFDSVGVLGGSQLLHFRSQYASARTAPLGYAIVPVFFATDRVRSGRATLDDFFANGREMAARPSLSYGMVHVSIPRDHRMGQIEAPKLWKFEFKPRPERHVMMLSLTALEQKPFFSSLDAELNSRAEGGALLFVHGYKVTFSDAVKRLAQIAYDLDWPGIPIVYSWASRAEFKWYSADEASIEATQPLFTDFLQRLIERDKLHQLHVISHSMGGRALTNGVANLKQNRKTKSPVINEIILAAPDIDSQVFTQMAAAVKLRSERITLYASSKDLALAASHVLHAFPRAGESGPQMVVLPEVLDTIDATEVDTNLLGHSYYGDNRSIIGDIYHLIKGRSGPPRFGLRELESPKGRYWAFKP